MPEEHIRGTEAMGHRDLQPELRGELEAIAEGEGCQLIHTEFKGGTLQLVLDRLEGVTLEHCKAVSRQASAILDVADFGAGRYTLEVSSPGLDRPLYGPDDYQRFAGSLARVTLRDPGDGARRTVVGRLGALQGNVLELAEEHMTKRGPQVKETHRIPVATIEKARLEIEL